MSDLICRRTMMRCHTPGMCSPHGGCQPDKIARAAQPVAVEGMPEPVAWMYIERDEERHVYKPYLYQQKWEVVPDEFTEHALVMHDAFTAWLSKAAQGMPEPETECPYWTESTQRNCWIQGAKGYRSAVQPLVAQLQAEVELLGKLLEEETATHVLEELTGDKALHTLRTANAELVGLLRECADDLPGLALAADDGHRTWEGLIADKDPTVDLCSRIDALLESAGGGDGRA